MRRILALCLVLCAILPCLANIVARRGIGRYSVPSGFMEARELSTPQRIVYVSIEDYRKKNFSNTISIESVKNAYTVKKHPLLRQEIVRQIVSELGDDEVLTGGGSYTKNGYVLYTFIIRPAPNLSDSVKTVSRLYYIVAKNKSHILVHEKTLGDSPKTDAAAIELVNSYMP